MEFDNSHRKTIKHFDEPDHVRELTFSCYRRWPLLTKDEWREMLSRAIERAITGHNWELAAFVYMPEHVHLLVFPQAAASKIEDLLRAIKRPYSFRIKQLMNQSGDPLLKRLTIRQRPGVQTFRYWQEGPGYDRNIKTAAAALNSIDYLHNNPVRRGLCDRAIDWKWSSARWCISDGQVVDPTLPRLTPIPSTFWL